MTERVRVGVIGTGRAGRIHISTLSRLVDGAELVALADPNPEAVREAGSDFGVERVFTDHRELLALPDMDAVWVVTPTVFHRQIVLDAAEAGKHVFCEKPMAMTVAECRDMNDAVDRAGVKLQIGFMRRFDAGFRRARELILDGRIGDVVTVMSRTHGPSVPQPWMLDLKASNGPLAEVTSHDIDTLRWLTGQEVTSLYTTGGNFRTPQARAEYPDFYDTFFLTANFDGGAIGCVDGAQGVQYGYDARVEILGTHGRLDIGDLQANRVTVHERDGVSRSDIVPSWRNLFADAYVAEDLAFVDAVRHDIRPLVTGEDGLRAVEIVAAGNESLRTHDVVRLDVHR